jgi:uncharacterized protein (TIGR02145 family)
MRLYFLLFALAISQISFSQSKKEQIVILTSRIDSLYQVVSLERKINDAEITKLKASNSILENKNSSLTTNITQLEGKILSLNTNISQLESKNSSLTANLALLESKNTSLTLNLDKLTSELQASKSELSSNKFTISSLQTQLAILSDSLAYLRSEFNRPKPAYRQVVSDMNTDQVSFKGNYATVKIGDQVWMVDNLNTPRFRNGDPIVEAKTNEEWQVAANNGLPAWCYYENKPANGVKYGKLYNWYAVNDSRGIAPTGFHVPSDDEWTALTDYLGYVNAGKKMKSANGWKYGVNGNNSSGFTGLPGGKRNYDGTFAHIGDYGHWWSSSEYYNGSDSAWDRTLNYDSETAYQHNSEKHRGFSVRCIKD